MKVKIFSFVLALIITGILFTLPVFVVNNNFDNQVISESNKIRFSLTKYVVLQKKAQFEKNDKNKSQIHKTETAKEINEPIKTQDNEQKSVDNVEQTNLSTQKENGVSALDVKSKEKKQKTIMYSPDFTIDKIPTYPMSARRLGQEGKVGVTVYVDENGKIINIIATKSSGFAVLDKAAINAVKSWKFARLNLKDKVNVIRTEVVFELN